MASPSNTTNYGSISVFSDGRVINSSQGTIAAWDKSDDEEKVYVLGPQAKIWCAVAPIFNSNELSMINSVTEINFKNKKDYHHIRTAFNINENGSIQLETYTNYAENPAERSFNGETVTVQLIHNGRTLKYFHHRPGKGKEL